MGPDELEDTIKDLNILTGKDGGKTYTIGRNGAKREITEKEVLEKYLERKASNGEFIESMKVPYAHRRGAVARRSVGKPPRETDAPAPAPGSAHLGPFRQPGHGSSAGRPGHGHAAQEVGRQEGQRLQP